MTNKVIILFLIVFVLGNCNSKNKNEYRHDDKTYFEIYSLDKLKDSLYCDTLKIGPDNEGLWTSRIFYIEKLNELFEDLKDDWGNQDSLFPLKKFDDVTIQKMPIGIKYSLSKNQIDKLLEVINNPTNFDWSESTDVPLLVVGFNYKEKRIGSFLISDNYKTILPFPKWPVFKKMKFGHLKQRAQEKLLILLKELGY